MQSAYRSVSLGAILACVLVALLALSWAAVGLLGSPEVQLGGSEDRVAAECAAVSDTPGGGGVGRIELEGERVEDEFSDAPGDRVADGVLVADISEACQQARTRRVVRAVVATPVVVLAVVTGAALVRRRHDDLTG